MLPSSAQELVEFIRTHIPLAHTMDLRYVHAEPGRLTLSAPLAPNINDKGCAFGGSLVSLMTLGGWAMVELALRARDWDCDVFVAESTVKYLAPVWEDLVCESVLSPHSDWDTFFSTLNARGRARIEVASTIAGESPDKPAATLRARFVAKKRG
ncbi:MULTISPECIES: YiiD C-terminal domain-containing protein [Dyella]|uniref:Thioesterase n=2 Tax=Dyella TaxID=231454 RepID=A0A4V2NLA7_9GAMM|nr:MULTISPECIES: YiiD C-terminal domain-containing protein [Dyella]TBR36715.1 thioesterase [Dyella terrae]TCI08194.1 thioesterase [Dyella soli]